MLAFITLQNSLSKSPASHTRHDTTRSLTRNIDHSGIYIMQNTMVVGGGDWLLGIK